MESLAGLGVVSITSRGLGLRMTGTTCCACCKMSPHTHIPQSTHPHTSVHIPTHLSPHTHIPQSTHTHIHVHVPQSTYPHTSVHTHTHTHTSVHTHTYLSPHTHIPQSTHLSPHTHIPQSGESVVPSARALWRRGVAGTSEASPPNHSVPSSPAETTPTHTQIEIV